MLIRVLHSSPYRYALPWDCIGSHDELDPLHIDVTEVQIYADRLALLTRLKTEFSLCPHITLYTGIPTSECNAPCGCFGYDSCCAYHRYREMDIAECWCSERFGIVCQYHAPLLYK